MTADKTLIRALLIDNDAGDRTYLCEQLGKAISVNFEVTETSQLDGFKAIKRYFRKGEFDCELLVRTIRNATERARIKIELKSSEQKYGALYGNVVAGVFSTTLDGQFISANPSMVKLLGYDTEEELLKIDIPSQIHACPEQRRRWVEQVHAAGEMLNSELRLRRKDGREITVLENSCLVYDSDGKPSHFDRRDRADASGGSAAQERGTL